MLLCVPLCAMAADVADTLLPPCSVWSRVAAEDMPAITAGLHERWEHAKGAPLEKYLAASLPVRSLLCSHCAVRHVHLRWRADSGYELHEAFTASCSQPAQRHFALLLKRTGGPASWLCLILTVAMRR